MRSSSAIEIDGASPVQEAILRDGSERLTVSVGALRVEPWDPVDWQELASLGVERGDPRYARPIGVALSLVTPEDPSLREEWELELLARTFRDRSAEAELPDVLWVATRDGGHSLDAFAPTDEPTPNPDAMVRMARNAAMTTRAQLAECDVLAPDAFACAVVLRVDEPHAFLRHGARAFVELSGHFDRGRRGSYLELRDADAEPAWITACVGGLGMGRVRGDVACCDPFWRQGTIEEWDAPRCPVFDRGR